MCRDLKKITQLLSDAGFIAAKDEAFELIESANGDAQLLQSLLDRRLTGEPLAWITKSTQFCGYTIQIATGVYIPRHQSEPLARLALARLPMNGAAIDLCTGSGAIAKTLSLGRPSARVVASEIDGRAVACAVSNGVEVYCGDLFTPIPDSLAQLVDVVVGVVPYVPKAKFPLLPRDTFAFETPLSYDGGADGLDIVRRVIADAPQFLRPGGSLLLELGADQVEVIEDDLKLLGYVGLIILTDEEDDIRGIEVTLDSFE
jgi:release factor glutamine methyltransferase